MSKILVVDDEKPISDIIKFNLTKEGYDVAVAMDGREALDLFESEEPDLVLLDQMLPEVEELKYCVKFGQNLKHQLSWLLQKIRKLTKCLV